jgi:hypothetical protein
MAKTIINLSDPVSTLVSKTNTISDHVGDITQLNVPSNADSDLVQAINHVFNNSTDSSVIIGIVDSAYVQDRQSPATSRATVLPFFIKDSANGIGLDSSEGRFFIAPNTVNTSMMENSAITAEKLAGDAVTSSKIADDQINSQHYVDGSIDTAHIADGQVTTLKLADSCVTEAKMANDAVGSAELKSLSTLLIKDVNGTTLKTIHGAGA